MTVTTTSSRISYAGNGSTTAFSVPFYFLAAADLAVIRTTAAGAQTTLVLNTDYTVTGAGVPSGGTVTCTVAPAVTESLTIFRAPAETQTTDYQPNDPFPAETHERALDKLTMIAQRLKDLISRSFTLSDGDVSGASTQLPSPAANQLIGWNATAAGLQNVNPSSLLTIAGSSGFSTQTFSGTGAQTAFTLSANPGALANLEVFVGGVRQTPSINYTVSGTTLTFFVAPPAGTNNILARWGTTLGIGVPADGSVTEAKLSGPISATAGGTGQTSYAIGDLLYAATTTTLAKLAGVATGNVLRSGGVGAAPAWGKVGLTTDVSGALPAGNGGTGAATLTANNVLLGNGTSALQTVAPGASGNVLTSNGTTWQSAAAPAGGVNVQVYTSGSGTFTIPSGVTKLKVTVVGGGGGSGGSAVGNAGGGGGGAGTAIKWLSGLTPGNTLSYSVGAGGTAGAATPTNGGAGGNSSVSSGTQAITTITGNGGGAGLTGGGVGAGGAATNGDLNITGSTPDASSNGGASFYSNIQSAQGAAAANAGLLYGGGASSISGANAGAAGGGGVVIFEW